MRRWLQIHFVGHAETQIFRSLKMVGNILNSVGELTAIDTINSTAASGQAGESQRIVRNTADSAVNFQKLEQPKLVQHVVTRLYGVH